MKGVHFSMGVSNSCRDLPGRKIGICRAYVEVGMRYGLDAGIVNAAGNVMGMMPHPEHAVEAALGGEDGRVLLGSLVDHVLGAGR